tara:strand:- start:444 stop:596 length:153 start_codon:yes stop_codon:yes gene_type:complete
MDREEKQNKKDIEKLVNPDHLKFLKKLKAKLKRDKGIKPRKKVRYNYRHK